MSCQRPVWGYEAMAICLAHGLDWTDEWIYWIYRTTGMNILYNFVYGELLIDYGALRYEFGLAQEGSTIRVCTRSG